MDQLRHLTEKKSAQTFWKRRRSKSIYTEYSNNWACACWFGITKKDDLLENNSNKSRFKAGQKLVRHRRSEATTDPIVGLNVFVQLNLERPQVLFARSSELTHELHKSSLDRIRSKTFADIFEWASSNIMEIDLAITAPLTILSFQLTVDVLQIAIYGSSIAKFRQYFLFFGNPGQLTFQINYGLHCECFLWKVDRRVVISERDLPGNPYVPCNVALYMLVCLYRSWLWVSPSKRPCIVPYFCMCFDLFRWAHIDSHVLQVDGLSRFHFGSQASYLTNHLLKQVCLFS